MTDWKIATWGKSFDLDRAYEDDGYMKFIQDTLAKNGLVCKALATHIIGQCVGDAPDPRLNNFAPPTLADQPAAIKEWAIASMKKAAKVADKMGVKVITGFTGSPIWKWLYSFPQTTEEMIENGYEGSSNCGSPSWRSSASTASSSLWRFTPANRL